MTEHIESCTWPNHCTFLEYDSCDCLIEEKSGYECEEDREYADENNMSNWKPCKYYLSWEQSIEILLQHVENNEVK